MAKNTLNIIILTALFFPFGFFSESKAAPAVVPPYPTNVAVVMYRLDENGTSTNELCTYGREVFGCTAFCEDLPNVCEQSRPAIGYPYSTSTIYAPIETYYLLDVVSQEMNPWIYNEPVALHAQAIASRSYLGWYINNAPSGYDNSNGRQVFIPFRFDSLNPTAPPLEPSTANPCAASSLNLQQRQICTAAASRYYIARADNNPNNYPAFAEYFADAKTMTRDHPELWRFPYLKGVDDPISTACDSTDFAGNKAGLSQRGANRWLRGHECSCEGAPVEPGNQPGGAWSVRWKRVEQILFHYYTGVHLREAGGEALSPNYRWNPLSISTSGDFCPPIMRHGYSCTFTIQV